MKTWFNLLTITMMKKYILLFALWFALLLSWCKKQQANLNQKTTIVTWNNTISEKETEEVMKTIDEILKNNEE